MPVVLTDPARARFFDALLGGVALVPPRVVWFGLSFGGANAAGLVAEPARSAGYRRVSRANTLDEFPSYLLVGAKSNLRTIEFPRATADWAVIKSLFLADGPESDPGSAVLAMVDLPPRTLRAGLVVTIEPGVLCWA